MSFEETTHGSPIDETERLHQQREIITSKASQDRQSLGGSIESKWSDLPEHAVKYLTIHCEGYLSMAIDEARKTLAEEPSAFDDPDLTPYLLDDCIAKAKSIAKHKKLSSVNHEGKQLDRVTQKLNDEIQLGELVTHDPAFKNLRGEALLNALQQTKLVKNNPSLQKYLDGIAAKLDQIRQVASTPEEAASINQILAGASLNLSGNNSLSVFSDVLAQVDSSDVILETTKQKVHKLFGAPTVKSGGDVNDALDRGRGVDSNGNKLPFDETHKVRIAANNYVYEEPDGQRTYEINLPDGRNLKTHFPTASDDQHTGDLGIVMGNLMAAEALGLAEPIFQRGWKITHGGTIDIHYDDIIKAKRLNEIFIGGTAGHDNRLLNNTDINRLKHDYQAFSREGDWATGDNDPTRQREDFRALGILESDGTLNWHQFERAAYYLQTKTSQGGVPDFEDLKRFLDDK